MDEASRDRFLVKLQLVLTFGSIIYHIHQGYMAARPADVGQAVELVVVKGFHGLLNSPLAFLWLLATITSYVLTGTGYQNPDVLFNAVVNLFKGSIIGLLLMPFLGLVFVVAVLWISFLPFMTFIRNIDYAIYLLGAPARYIKEMSTRKKQVLVTKEKPLYIKNNQVDENVGVNDQTPHIVTERKLDAFDSLIGVDRAVEEIKDALELPLLYPEKVREYGIKPPKGLLLCGPPGTGKTSLARATAEYFGCAFFDVKGSELLKPHVGSSEAAVQQLFEGARKYRPSVIFFDEIDAICRKRDGSNLNRASDIILNILLAEMDGFKRDEGIYVIGATNRIDVLDDAVLRPGRFDSIIELSLPNEEDRIKLFKLFLTGKPIKERLNLLFFAEKTAGMSPAQIEAICKKAALRALKRDIETGCGGIIHSDIVKSIEEEKNCYRKGGG